MGQNEAPRETKLEGAMWEPVDVTHNCYRLLVPGGWLYMSGYRERGQLFPQAMCFVPNPDPSSVTPMPASMPLLNIGEDIP